MKRSLSTICKKRFGRYSQKPRPSGGAAGSSATTTTTTIDIQDSIIPWQPETPPVDPKAEQTNQDQFNRDETLREAYNLLGTHGVEGYSDTESGASKPDETTTITIKDYAKGPTSIVNEANATSWGLAPDSNNPNKAVIPKGSPAEKVLQYNGSDFTVKKGQEANVTDELVLGFIKKKVSGFEGWEEAQQLLFVAYLEGIRPTTNMDPTVNRLLMINRLNDLQQVPQEFLDPNDRFSDYISDRNDPKDKERAKAIENFNALNKEEKWNVLYQIWRWKIPPSVFIKTAAGTGAGNTNWTAIERMLNDTEDTRLCENGGEGLNAIGAKAQEQLGEIQTNVANLEDKEARGQGLVESHDNSHDAAMEDENLSAEDKEAVAFYRQSQIQDEIDALIAKTEADQTELSTFREAWLLKQQMNLLEPKEIPEEVTQSQIDEKKKEIEKLEADYQADLVKATAYHTNQATFDADLTKARADLNTFTGQKNEAQSQLDALNQKNHKSRADEKNIQELTAKILELDASIKTAEADISQLDETIKWGKKNTPESLTAKTDAAKDELAALEQNRAAYTEYLNKHQGYNNAKQKYEAKYSTLSAASQASLDGEPKFLEHEAALRRAIDADKAEINALEAEHKGLEDLGRFNESLADIDEKYKSYNEWENRVAQNLANGRTDQLKQDVPGWTPVLTEAGRKVKKENQPIDELNNTLGDVDSTGKAVAGNLDNVKSGAQSIKELGKLFKREKDKDAKDPMADLTKRTEGISARMEKIMGNIGDRLKGIMDKISEAMAKVAPGEHLAKLKSGEAKSTAELHAARVKARLAGRTEIAAVKKAEIANNQALADADIAETKSDEELIRKNKRYTQFV